MRIVNLFYVGPGTSSVYRHTLTAVIRMREKELWRNKNGRNYSFLKDSSTTNVITCLYLLGQTLCWELTIGFARRFKVNKRKLEEGILANAFV